MSYNQSLPVSVVVVTKQEAKRLADCLAAIQGFGDVLVYNSGEDDVSRAIAKEFGARFEVFRWNGAYPKKRQYCLDHIPLVYDWVFFVDADEIVTPELVEAIRAVFLDQSPEEAGFFVTGRYEIKGRVMRFGMPNRKIALFHKKRMMFPVVDDLDLSGMGEIEGHYQPVCVRPDGRIGSFPAYLLHRAYEDERAWAFRHEKYARWEAGMSHNGAWPVDPVPWREFVKRFLRTSRFRAEWMFVYIYVFRLGILDGRDGLKLAMSKYKYYVLIGRLMS